MDAIGAHVGYWSFLLLAWGCFFVAVYTSPKSVVLVMLWLLFSHIANIGWRALT